MTILHPLSLLSLSVSSTRCCPSPAWAEIATGSSGQVLWKKFRDDPWKSARERSGGREVTVAERVPQRARSPAAQGSGALPGSGAAGGLGRSAANEPHRPVPAGAAARPAASSARCGGGLWLGDTDADSLPGSLVGLPPGGQTSSVGAASVCQERPRDMGSAERERTAPDPSAVGAAPGSQGSG